MVREGGCACGAVQYRFSVTPLITHCCHCSWCQRESGSAFATNTLLEMSALEVKGEVKLVDTPSASGRGQTIARCPICEVALWSHYSGGGLRLAFVRVGTLRDPTAFPPDVHIYTTTKQPWVVLPPGAKAFDAFYSVPDVWSAEALARAKAAMEAG